LADGKFNFSSDQLQVALCNAANPPLATDGVLADETQIAYTNLSTQEVTTVSSTQTGGTYSCVVGDLTLTASGNVAAFQYVIVFDQTAANDELICYYDYGSEVTLINGETFKIDFGTSLFTLV
jgi:hypothetical protein